MLQNSRTLISGVMVGGVAKVENQVHGCHGLTVTLLFLPKNSLNIAVLIQILFGHGKTMTAMNIYPQLCNALGRRCCKSLKNK